MSGKPSRNNKKQITRSKSIKTPIKAHKAPKRKFKKTSSNPIIVFIIVVTLVIVGITADLFYSETVVGSLVADTIGKFFNLMNFFENYYIVLLESITIIIFVWVLSKILALVIRVFFRGSQRNRTVGVIFSGVIRYILVLIAIFLILSAWGVEAPTLLAGAGILGLAISFGAQSLIEDILSGLFIVSEKQFSIGDVIEIDGFRGKVIEMSIRTTKFESIMGDTKIMNNSDIRGAINTSSNLSPAICDIAISYSENIEKVEKIIYANLDVIREKLVDIINGPYYRGVQELSDSSVVLRIVGFVHEDKKLQTIRDLNREMKILFDKNNIKIPFPQIVVHYEDFVKKTSSTTTKPKPKPVSKPKPAKKTK
ncbi:mechanosensitive ion channel family protein [Liberiplasma polymorphum]|uniref:mechanosensitive ion channel family protein n=1 Tax=Liberiplasma polymorphum TaxID=3374570 RepID=UPI003772C35F